MKAYNGFSHAERSKALRWFQAEVRAGRRTMPLRCDACGQDQGPVDPHSENYSEPFGNHIGEHALCYRCHMMIHTRFKNPLAWETYKRHIREGRCFAPIDRNFYRFVDETLTRLGAGVPFVQGEPRERTFLDDLA